jgi:pimeloyl-ACP methyl ester carboxylesterase
VAHGTILAFHGNPTWSIEFAKVAELAQSAGYRFIAFDYLGYGMSDKPDPTRFDYRFHSQARVATELMRRLDLHGVTMLFQDGGSAVGLGAAQSEPDRVKNLLFVNPIPFTEAPNTTSGFDRDFVFTDWSLDNIENEQYYMNTGWNTLQGASATVKQWGIDPDSPAAAPLRRMMLAPYFVDGDGQHPLSASVHVPHVHFVQSVIQDRDYLRALTSGMTALREKPAYFIFTDGAVAYGALRCAWGPVSRIRDFSAPDAVANGAHQLVPTHTVVCPATYSCSDNPVKPSQSRCLDAIGKDDWYLADAYKAAWDAKAIAGVEQDPTGAEYVVMQSPEQVMMALTRLHDFTRAP